ncbi:hypothetical protein [Pseudemcibacter aquimaris]|uniref:hypothetical protein n=1 Tax=Pseudemcibacter aquimaris TaxID=2857064 RepID=UPI00201333CB|nr:hypothetical protein [Pseudemcibacter aquimaris]MCC3862469.1 hypothetical protein [Pseudemcibacter aquimaris]WDU59103.1 hypothetical protein KW060_02315 [Pseudemcibacter aquimaris]
MSDIKNTTKTSKSVKTFMMATTALVAVPMVLPATVNYAAADSFSVTSGFTNLLQENLGDGETGYIENGSAQNGDVTISGNTNVTLTNEGLVTGKIVVDNTGAGSTGVSITNDTSATISNSQQAIRVTSGSDISGGIDNDGVIVGDQQAILVD